MKKIIVYPGEIFCIPLFMPKDDWDLKMKLSDEDLDKEFAFGRVIETSSSVLVAPLLIFWDGVVKKRWRIIGKTENYDKYKHSNYDNLKMIFGVGEDFRLRHFSTKKETPITREEFNGYQFSIVWFPIDLENRILKAIE